MATTITANGINFPDGSASAPSIGGTDTNTGLFTGSDLVGFATGGTERLRITSDGELLVGTTVDNGFKFKVSDGGGYEFAFAPNDSSINSLVNYDRANGAYVDCKITSRSLRLWIGTSPSEKIRITSDGDVGIGTTSPSKKLEITTTGSSGEGIKLKSTDSTYPSVIGDSNRSGAGLFLIALQGFWDGKRVSEVTCESGPDTTNKDDGIVVIRTRNHGDTSPQDRVTVDQAGNVGIGTTSPGYKLEVVDSGGALLKLNTSHEGTYDLRFVYQNSEANIWSYGSTDLTFGTRYNKKLHLVTNGPSKRLTIDGSGNIGIGTTSPDKSLTIGGSTPVIKLNDGNGRILELRGGSTTHNPGLVTTYASNLYLGSNSTESVHIGTEHLTITNGNLIIGTAGHGISFAATGDGTGSMGDELLDDYEQGTWSPTIYGGTTAGSYSYQANRTGGKYTKIGNMVYIEGVLRIESITSAGAGDLYMGGMPYSTSGPMASSWTIGKGVQFFMYGTSGNTTASIAEPPFVGTASGGASAFNIRSYGKNLNVMPQIEDFDNQWWIFQVAGWYPVN